MCSLGACVGRGPSGPELSIGLTFVLIITCLGKIVFVIEHTHITYISNTVHLDDIYISWIIIAAPKTSLLTRETSAVTEKVK